MNSSKGQSVGPSRTTTTRVRTLFPKIHGSRSRTRRHKVRQGSVSVTGEHWQVHIPEKVRRAAQEELLGIALQYLHAGDVLQLRDGATPESLAKAILAPSVSEEVEGAW